MNAPEADATVPGCMDLSGRRILVTGASSGIGREISIVLSQFHARLVLAGRDCERLQATLAMLSGAGHEAVAFDLASSEQIPRWLKGIAEASGPFAGLVHSAGVHGIVPVNVLSVNKLEQTMRINFTAGLMLAKAFRQNGCHDAGGGSIVFLSSVTGLVGEPGVTAYAASKAALIGATRTLALEFAPNRIRVNCIAPGLVRSEMTEALRSSLPPEKFAAIEAMHPLGLGSARDVAHAAAFLLADTAAWITGSTLVVDGGYTAR